MINGLNHFYLIFEEFPVYWKLIANTSANSTENLCKVQNLIRKDKFQQTETLISLDIHN